MARNSRSSDRLAMGPGAVLTVNEAAGLLPVSDREARLWLAGRGLIRDLAGRPVVVWRDVLAALSEGEDPEGSTSPPLFLPLPRVSLKPL